LETDTASAASPASAANAANASALARERNQSKLRSRERSPAGHAGGRRRALLAALLIDDGIAQHADAGDVDLDDVAGFQPERRLAPRADAARRARHEHVAGLELRPDRAIRDQI